MPPQISVIIPAHNEENYLNKTLDTLRQQNFLDYETIIVCNGCTDQTEAVAQNYLNQTTKIFNLPEANVCKARNLGAAKASSSLVFFLDADCLLKPTALQKIIKSFTEKYSVATTFTKPDLPDLKYQIALGFKNIHNYLRLYKGCSGALVCRREQFLSVGGYPPEIIIKEHKILTEKLKKFGKYKTIPTAVTTSMRRFQNWGLTKAAGFWVKAWFKKKFSKLEDSKYEVVR